MPRPRIAVFVSGSGRSLENLAVEAREGRLEVEIALVLCNVAGALALERAQRLGIPAQVLDAERKLSPPEFSARAFAAADAAGAKLVVLAGFLRLLRIPPTWEGRVINIHPALLPKYGGKGFYGDKVHAAVLAARETESGCTVHYVTDEYDKGPVLLQRRVPVLPGDDVHALAARVFEAEKQALPEAIREHFSRQRRSKCLSFVLLERPAEIDARAVCDKHQQLFPGVPAPVPQPSDRGAESPGVSVLQLEAQGEDVFLALMPVAIPDHEAEAYLRFSPGTREGDERRCAASKAHVAVVTGNRGLDLAGQLRHMRIVAALLEASGAIAVYHAPATHMRRWYVENARSECPVLALLAQTRLPDEGDRCAFFAYDPGDLGGPDIVVSAPRGEAEEAWTFLTHFCWYVMQRGKPLAAGETTGRSASEKLPLREAASPLDAGRRVLRIDLPQS